MNYSRTHYEQQNSRTVKGSCIVHYQVNLVPGFYFSYSSRKYTQPVHEQMMILMNFPHLNFNVSFALQDGNSVAAAAVYGTKVKKCGLPNKSSIFSAEVKGIDLALDLVEQSDSSRFIIFSDSLSSLQALHNQKLENPSVCNVLECISHLVEFKRIVFCWLPSHMGIRGNEKADETAKSALSLPKSNYKVPYTDFKTSILTYTQSFWQSQWDADLFNKLHSVKPTLGEWYPSYRSIRREEVIITRLRIGHSHLTHSWLLAKQDAPECIQCNEYLPMNHILLDCIDFQPIREKHYNADSMYNLFDTVSIDSVIAFIKEIGLYNKL